jgi:DNA polymerase
MSYSIQYGISGKNYFGIDTETFSSEDLKLKGLHKYVASPDFEILLLCGKRNRQSKEQYDLARGEKLPDEVMEILLSWDWIKTSYNVAFEIAAIEKHFGITLIKEQWECTQIRAAMLGFPMTLDGVAKAMRLNIQKNAAGKNLIKMFSCPCKPTKINGMTSRIMPDDNLPKWEKYKEYNRDDVEVEDAIKIELDKYQYEISDFEKRLWLLDQKINNYGVMMDLKLVRNAIALDKQNREKLRAEAIELTGIANPNSPEQIRAWLEEATGDDIPTLKKEDVIKLITKHDDKIINRLLVLRQELSKTSIKKYDKMTMYVGEDGRLRGLLQYYGANRTGRFAGRGPQIHNYPKNILTPLAEARELVVRRSAEGIDMIFGSLSYVLSQLLRTAIIPSENHIFGIADYAAIEARIIAYLAGEKWRMEVFKGDGKIYEASAAKMFNVAIELVTKHSDYRAKGKVSELALGYQGSVDALIRMGALKMGIPEAELPLLVKRWRIANPKIVAYWDTINEAAIRCVKFPGTKVSVGKGISFQTTGNIMYITLPSGRKLSYVRPRIEENRFGNEGVVYDGMNQVTKVWGKQETYGGKLVENIVQAVARDVLATALLRLDEAKYKIPFHVHDEAIADIPLFYVDKNGDLQERSKESIQTDLDIMCQIMEIPVDWASDLPLKAEGFLSTYYKKED